MKKHTQLIAHRGHWNTGFSVQNSVQALTSAQNLRIYGSECDVRPTADGEILVYHDQNVAGMRISRSNYQELKDIKLGNGEPLPTLETYLKQARKAPATKLIIELKNLENRKLERRSVIETVKRVRKYRAQWQVRYISFSLFICELLKEELHTSKVQYLKGDLSPQEIKYLGFDGMSYHYTVFDKNPTWLAEAKELNLITTAWTVNNVKTFKKLCAQGIDYITTDIPEVFRDLG